MKHTPGPWCLEPIDNGKYGYGIREQDDGYLIATVHQDDTNIHLADANLIVAAPDLFDSIDQLLKMIGDHVPHSHISSNFEATIFRAYEVLAKIRGES